ncbi:MAG: sulfotransferase [Novosphingobium sp.]
MTGPASADLIIRCCMAGWLDEEQAASKLDLDIAEFDVLMQDHGLADKAMMPFAIDSEHVVSFADVGRQDFSLPRFDDTIDGLRELSLGSKPLCFPLAISNPPDFLKPSHVDLPQGLIFHVGRCGSTLLSVLLGELLDCTTLKEPEVVNHLLARRSPDAAADGVSDEMLLRLMQSFAAGVRRAGGIQRRDCLIKMTSWNLIAIGDLLDRVVGLRAVMLVRDPISTVASMVANPPGWYYSSQHSPSSSVETMVRIFVAEWASIVRAALRLKSPPLIIDYDGLMRDPFHTVCAIADHFRMPVPDTRQALAAAAPILGRYVKSGGYEHYDPGGQHKRSDLSDAHKALVHDLAGEVWREVRELAGLGMLPISHLRQGQMTAGS